MRLFHFSDRDDIAEFVPRAPVRHPEAEPLVYAIDEAHSPLYLFPRDCPRIAVWPLDRGVAGLRLLIDARFEEAWRGEGLVRYEFDPADGFEYCHDHGVWVSRLTVRPVAVERLESLPDALTGCSVEVVPSLAEASREFYDPAAGFLRPDWHVSMIRMSLLPDWGGPVGTPVGP